MAQKHGLGRGLSSLIPQKTVNGSSAAKKDLVRGVDRRAAQSSTAASKKTVRTSENIEIEDPRERRSAAKVSTRSTQASTEKEEVSLPAVSSKRELAVIGLPTHEIIPNTQQPRIYFDETKLDELSASIKEHGIMQPLVVVKKGEGYELIAGERRLRAAKKAGLSKVPAIVRGDMDEQKKLEMAIIENVQRHDLNVIEEAKSYKKLADEFDLTQEEVAKKMGKSRSVVANRMRLATLPIEIQRGLVDGKISEGHAKVILSLDNPEKQRGLYEMIVSGRMSVRDAEKALVGAKTGMKVSSHTRGSKSSQERMLEDQLGAYFGTKVQVKQKGIGGAITMSYYSQEELKNMLGKLKL